MSASNNGITSFLYAHSNKRHPFIKAAQYKCVYDWPKIVIIVIIIIIIIIRNSPGELLRGNFPGTCWNMFQLSYLFFFILYIVMF